MVDFPIKPMGRSHGFPIDFPVSQSPILTHPEIQKMQLRFTTFLS